MPICQIKTLIHVFTLGWRENTYWVGAGGGGGEGVREQGTHPEEWCHRILPHVAKLADQYPWNQESNKLFVILNKTHKRIKMNALCFDLLLSLKALSAIGTLTSSFAPWFASLNASSHLCFRFFMWFCSQLPFFFSCKNKSPKQLVQKTVTKVQWNPLKTKWEGPSQSLLPSKTSYKNQISNWLIDCFKSS